MFQENKHFLSYNTNIVIELPRENPCSNDMNIVKLDVYGTLTPMAISSRQPLTRDR